VLVEDGRAAFAAESAQIAARALEERDEVFAGEPAHVVGLHAHAAAEGGAVLLAALRAVAVERAHQRPRDFEADAAAETTAVNSRRFAGRRAHRTTPRLARSRSPWR